MQTTTKLNAGSPESRTCALWHSLLLAAFLAVVAHVAQAQQVQALPGYEKGLESITAQEMISHVTYLASEELAGRAAGSSGNLEAAHYIATRFAALGMTPLFPPRNAAAGRADTTEDRLLAAFKADAQEKAQDNEAASVRSPEREALLERYYQKFTIRKSGLAGEQDLSLDTRLEGGAVTQRYQYQSDFLLQYGGAPRSQKLTAPVVFAGYGIDEGEQGYNDYAGDKGASMDVKDKIVLVVDGFPRQSDPASPFAVSRKPLYRNALRKAEAAARRGALALLVVASPLKVEPPFLAKYEQLARAFNREVDHLPERASASIPIVFIAPQVAADLFARTGARLDSILRQIDLTLKPKPFVLPARQMSIDIAVRSRSLLTQNIAGLVEGTDPVLKREVLVIGAHYDHVGLGYYGAMNRADSGKIHYGADDNASGTAGLLEIAEAVAMRPPKRSVLFLAFSGEENGLLGSRYYVTVQPLRPLDSTVAMLNCDMIGRNEPEALWIGGAFTSEDLRKVVEASNTTAGTKFELLYNVGLLNSASDQAPFLRRSIPAVFFFAGLHDDYHTPADVAEKVDGEKSARIARLAYMTAWNVANAPARPRWQELPSAERAAISRESVERLHRLRPPAPGKEGAR